MLSRMDVGNNTGVWLTRAILERSHWMFRSRRLTPLKEGGGWEERKRDEKERAARLVSDGTTFYEESEALLQVVARITVKLDSARINIVETLDECHGR